MRPDITVGGTFPDYALTDHTGTRRTLSELQGDDPMILVLSRGHFCPKDRRQLRNLVDLYPELKVGYTGIVTISTDTLLETTSSATGWVPSGRSSPTPDGRSSRTSTSRSTPTPTTTR